MNQHQLQTFCAIAEHGSFSKAADALFLSQSSLSKQIMQLEKELGVTLFDRTRRQIELTEAGGILLEHAKKMLSVHASLLRDLDDYQKSHQSTLRIASIPVMAQYRVTDWITAFGEAYPEIDTNVVEKDSLEIVQGLEQGLYDIGFTRREFLDEERYGFIDLCADRFVLVMSREHTLACLEAPKLSDFAKCHFVFLTRETLLYDRCMSACLEAGFEPKIVFTGSRLENITQFIQNHHAVAILMEPVAKMLDPARFKAVVLEQMAGSRPAFVYPKKQKPQKPARLFLSFLRSRGLCAAHAAGCQADACPCEKYQP